MFFRLCSRAPRTEILGPSGVATTISVAESGPCSTFVAFLAASFVAVFVADFVAVFVAVFVAGLAAVFAALFGEVLVPGVLVRGVLVPGVLVRGVLVRGVLEGAINAPLSLLAVIH
jgi:hypothetical protein